MAPLKKRNSFERNPPILRETLFEENFFFRKKKTCMLKEKPPIKRKMRKKF